MPWALEPDKGFGLARTWSAVPAPGALATWEPGSSARRASGSCVTTAYSQRAWHVGHAARDRLSHLTRQLAPLGRESRHERVKFWLVSPARSRQRSSRDSPPDDGEAPHHRSLGTDARTHVTRRYEAYSLTLARCVPHVGRRADEAPAASLRGLPRSACPTLGALAVQPGCRVRRLPVVTDDHEVVGSISRADRCRALPRHAEKPSVRRRPRRGRCRGGRPRRASLGGSAGANRKRRRALRPSMRKPALWSSALDDRSRRCAALRPTAVT